MTQEKIIIPDIRYHSETLSINSGSPKIPTINKFSFQDCAENV